MVLQQRLYTVDEFERILELPENDRRPLELINGEIVEKVTTEEHGWVGSILNSEIYIFLKQHKLAGIVVQNVHYRAPNDPHNVRLPDVSYTSPRDRDIVKRGSTPEIPDLCVEVKSRSNTYKELREKSRYYLANGARLVWLVVPEKKQVEVYAPDFEDVLDIEGTLTGRDVLPGFELAVNKLFVNPLRGE